MFTVVLHSYCADVLLLQSITLVLFLCITERNKTHLRINNIMIDSSSNTGEDSEIWGPK